MKVRIPPPDIPPQDPFVNDVFGRREFGESLTSLVAHASEGLVISLNAPWGEGKTTFVKMWQAALTGGGYPTIYFDAFAHDYLDDPFVGIAGELLERLDLAEGERSDLRRKASRAGAQLLTWATKIGVRAATLGVIKSSDLEELESIKDDISKGVSDLASAYIDQRLQSYRNDMKALDDFREFLEAAASKAEKPVVFIIDELDRCKPTYAVGVLERIKHIFSVKGVAFVLVLNREQLADSIRWIYGSEVDAQNYLQKFIDVECRLPKNLDRHQSDYEKYSRNLFRKHEFEAWGEGDSIVDAVARFATKLGLSLRSMQKVYAQVAIFYASSQQNHLRIPAVIVLLSVLRLARPALYGSIANRTATYHELRSEPALAGMGDDEWLSNILKVLMMKDDELKGAMSEDEQRAYMRDVVWRYNVNRLDVLPIFCSRLDRFRLPAAEAQVP